MYGLVLWPVSAAHTDKVCTAFSSFSQCKLCNMSLLTEPDWASYTLGVFVCLNCSGMHRNLPSVSKVKSIRLDRWEDSLVQVLVCNLYLFYLDSLKMHFFFNSHFYILKICAVKWSSCVMICGEDFSHVCWSFLYIHDTNREFWHDTLYTVNGWGLRATAAQRLIVQATNRAK